MQLTESEKAISEKAIEFAKKNRTKICRRLTDKSIYLPENDPVAVFMSGSPGAGKTESSKEFIQSISNNTSQILRLDPDDLRIEFEDYDGSNSYLFQQAVITLVERAIDYTFKNNQSFVLDGTLSSYSVAEKNVRRAIDKKRKVLIIFVYQRPELAWKFVKARETVEGRRILPQHFVEQFFGAQEVIKKLKEEFKDEIQVDLLIKDNDGQTCQEETDIDNLKTYLDLDYTIEDINKIVGI